LQLTLVNLTTSGKCRSLHSNALKWIKTGTTRVHAPKHYIMKTSLRHGLNDFLSRLSHFLSCGINDNVTSGDIVLLTVLLFIWIWSTVWYGLRPR